MEFIIDNYEFIITTAIAVIAGIFIPIWIKKRKNEKLEKPQDTIKNVTHHYHINITGNQNYIGEIHFPPKKNIALPSLSNDYKDESNISYLIKKLYKDVNSGKVNEDLQSLTLSLLKEFGNEIPNLFSYHEHAEILEFLQNISFKYKIKNILLELFIDANLTENERYNAGLFCIYLIKDDSIKLFISDDWNKHLPNDTIKEQNVIEYLFNLINIGFSFYNYDYSFDNYNDEKEFNSRFKEIFSTIIEEITFRFIASENNSIVWAASWALVWIINAKVEKQNIKYSWSSDDKVYEVLLDAFSKAKQTEIIKMLMFVIHKLNIEKCAFKNNFIYECAFCIDNDLEIGSKSVEPINIDITKLIYSKYIQSNEPVKNILAEYLAKYGYFEVSIATRLLSTNLNKLNFDFVSFVLLPYVNQINDRGIVSFVIEWLNSNDDKINFYALLLQKSIERVTNEVINLFKDNNYAMTNILNSNPNNQLPTKKGIVMQRTINLVGHYCHKLKAKDTTGRWALYIVLVNPYTESEFLKAIDGDGTIDLTDFGTVVASAYGEKFPNDLDNFMFSQYK